MWSSVFDGGIRRIFASAGGVDLSGGFGDSSGIEQTSGACRFGDGAKGITGGTSAAMTEAANEAAKPNEKRRI